MVQKIGGNGGLHVTCVLVLEIRKTFWALKIVLAYSKWHKHVPLYIFKKRKKRKRKKREGKHTTWAGSAYMILSIADIFISICHYKKHPTKITVNHCSKKCIQKSYYSALCSYRLQLQLSQLLQISCALSKKRAKCII